MEGTVDFPLAISTVSVDKNPVEVLRVSACVFLKLLINNFIPLVL